MLDRAMVDSIKCSKQGLIGGFIVAGIRGVGERIWLSTYSRPLCRPVGRDVLAPTDLNDEQPLQRRIPSRFSPTESGLRAHTHALLLFAVFTALGNSTIDTTVVVVAARKQSKTKGGISRCKVPVQHSTLQILLERRVRDCVVHIRMHWLEGRRRLVRWMVLQPYKPPHRDGARIEHHRSERKAPSLQARTSRVECPAERREKPNRSCRLRDFFLFFSFCFKVYRTYLIMTCRLHDVSTRLWPLVALFALIQSHALSSTERGRCHRSCSWALHVPVG